MSAAAVCDVHFFALGRHTESQCQNRRQTSRARFSKRHANGTPLATIQTGANVDDVTQLLLLIDAIPQIRRMRRRSLS
ncbi:hypothetical protein WT49_20140 [Burkholderia territorii]|nr:hypothetical protein WT49_20140 [Burkholderia territorii]KWE46954.1 hypothetical protein WT50_08805 [Burkholderia territorii]KWE54310.1 hypothetical protein WT51_03630 [Burkholderia territorii]